MSFRKVLTTKTMTTSTLKLKAELLKWTCKRHATNEPLDRKLLRDKAMELAGSFGLTGFKCSEAWLTVFLKKHGFSPSLTNCNGPTFTDYRVWIDLLRSLITQYRHKDLFNVDELVMYSNFLPSGNRIMIPFQHHGDNIIENHDLSRISSETKKISILLCCNSSGTEKLEPLISNPYVLEKSLDESSRNHRELITASNENFVIWLEKFNARMSNSHRNVLLLLSRDKIRHLHNFHRLSNVKLLFLPKDFPTQLRPLRGDVFHSVKMTYRRRYVEFVRSRERATREWDTKEIVETIFEAWKDVPQELIVASFQRTKFREDETSLKIQCREWDALETGMSFRKYVTFDDELSDAKNRGIYEEMRFLSSTSNEHRYNLRKSRKNTIELGDDRDVVRTEESLLMATKIHREIRDMDEEIRHRKMLDSGVKKVQRSSRYEELESSAIYEGCAEANDDSREIDSNVPEVIGSYGKGDSIEESSIAHTSSYEINEKLKKKRTIVDRYSRVANYSCDDFRPEVTLKSDEFVNFEGASTMMNDDNEDGGQTSSAMPEENLRDSSRDAGPSGNAWFYSRESLGAIDSRLPMDFEDEEKMGNDDELRINISKAIEICDDMTNNGDENVFVTKDRAIENSKRSRSCCDADEENFDDEPRKKFARSEGDWSKRYETSFVFGPDMNDNPNEAVSQSSMDERKINRDASLSDGSKISQTGNEEIEKRCIFTLEGSNESPSVSYPQTKD